MNPCISSMHGKRTSPVVGDTILTGAWELEEAAAAVAAVLVGAGPLGEASSGFRLAALAVELELAASDEFRSDCASVDWVDVACSASMPMTWTTDQKIKNR